MPKILEVHAREVFDSRGRPTVEAEVRCAGGRLCRSIVPSGASTGTAEARELRDGGSRLMGFGVRQAVQHVNRTLGPAVIGMDAEDQSAVDQRLCELDGTAQKAKLGANAILACSLASAYACADAVGQLAVEHLAAVWRGHKACAGKSVTSTAGLGTHPTLPMPMVNMISGGLHAGRNLDFQDFLIVPIGATTYSEALEWIVDVYFRLGKLLTARGWEGVLVGDEGGYGPKVPSPQIAIELILTAIEQAGRKPGTDIGLAIDVASSHFHQDGGYRLSTGGGETLTAEEMIAVLVQLVQNYPILSLEDGLSEDDWPGWEELTRQLGTRTQLIGDDLFATNPQRLREGISRQAGNSVLIKLNQIGTLTETLQTMRLALDHGYRPVISARSGETEDVTIADLAVATGAGQIKIGSVARSERLAKYNQLLRWESQLGATVPFAGRTPFAGLSSNG